MMRSIAIFFMALAAAGAQAGDVYKWKDKDGKVHYGDRPRPDARAVELLSAPSADEPQDPEAAKAAAARLADCEKKREQLEKYRSATAIKETDNLGQVREYTPAEREKFLERQQKLVAEACAAAPAQQADPEEPAEG